MSNKAGCYLNCKGDIIKLVDKCRNPKGNFRKLITFTPRVSGGRVIKLPDLHGNGWRLKVM